MGIGQSQSAKFKPRTVSDRLFHLIIPNNGSPSKIPDIKMPLVVGFSFGCQGASKDSHFIPLLTKERRQLDSPDEF